MGTTRTPRRRAGTRRSSPPSLEVNVNEALAVVEVLLFWGPPVMVVSGGVVSVGGTATVQVRVAGVGSMLVAASVARTVKVWLPFGSAG